ncbi:hypothetical protein Mapa_003059 [Marchantia paleacea]|nr:hypothetical protein Mapa_003059 [Marchantia paleacea]
MSSHPDDTRFSEDYENPPTDTSNLALLTYFLLGIGCILPWTTFTTAVDYFEYLYPDSQISRVFVAIFQFSFFISLSLMLRFGLQIPSRVRINVGLLMLLCPILLVPTVNALIIREDADRNNPLARTWTLIFISLAAIGTAVMEGSVTGSAGELPQEYMRAVVSGTGACGVLVSSLRIATKAAMPQTPDGLRTSANVYFVVTSAILLLCFVSYNLIHRLPIMIHYTALRAAINKDKSVAKEALLAGRQDLETEVSSSLLVNGDGEMPEGRGLVATLATVKWYAGCVILTYGISMSIFPGFLAEDVHSSFLKDWYAVLLICSFQCSDLLGKLCTSLYIPKLLRTLVLGSLARLLFLPLFRVILHGPGAFRTEAAVFLSTFLLGFTGGYLSASNFVLAPKLVTFAQAESVGMIMDLCLGFGVSMGSVLTFLWTW